MLQSDIHALLNVSVADLLVENDADGGFRDVVDDAGLAVVDLVGHAFLLRAVVLDVDDVSDAVGFHVCRQGDHAFLAEGAGESVGSLVVVFLAGGMEEGEDLRIAGSRSETG